MAAVVGTWSFSSRAVEVIADELMQGKECLAALEKGMNEVEDDPGTGPYLVGRGGYPNAEGVLECDAAVMIGEGCKVGAVAALQGVATPFSVARLVLEQSPHSMLVGNGARDFAAQNGIAIEDQQSLQTSKSRNAFMEFKEKIKNDTCTSRGGYDTLGVIALDTKGHLVAGVSSSGKPFKLPGRVGDSPIPGSGLYADDEMYKCMWTHPELFGLQVGAAVATGDGDEMMRFCPSFHAVQLMKQARYVDFVEVEKQQCCTGIVGYSPQEACELVVKESQRKAGSIVKPIEMALIAIDNKGAVGAATTVSSWKDLDGNTYPGFPYAIWTHDNKVVEIRVQPPIQR